MKKHQLILHLLENDLRYNQLLLGLEKMQLQSAAYYELDLCTIVASLMGLPPGKVPDAWLRQYERLMQRATELPPNEQVGAFRQLAKEVLRALEKGKK